MESVLLGLSGWFSMGASPAVAEALMPKLVRDLIGIAIDDQLPAFGQDSGDGETNLPPQAEAQAAWAADVATHCTELVTAAQNGFELLRTQQVATASDPA